MSTVEDLVKFGNALLLPFNELQKDEENIKEAQTSQFFYWYVNNSM